MNLILPSVFALLVIFIRGQKFEAHEDDDSKMDLIAFRQFVDEHSLMTNINDTEVTSFVSTDMSGRLFRKLFSKIIRSLLEGSPKKRKHKKMYTSRTRYKTMSTSNQKRRRPSVSQEAQQAIEEARKAAKAVKLAAEAAKKAAEAKQAEDMRKAAEEIINAAEEAKKQTEQSGETIQNQDINTNEPLDDINEKEMFDQTFTAPRFADFATA